MHKPRRLQRVTQGQVAKVVGVSQTLVSKVLSRDPRYRPREATRQRVVATARRLGYDLSRIHPVHRRQHSRQPVNLPAQVTIRLHDGRCYARGRARVYERSQGGALVREFRLSKMALPLRPFTIELEMEERPGRTVRLVYRLVRVVMDGTVGLGLQAHRQAA